MSTPGHVDNSIFIDAPMDLVWDITNDVEGWPQLFTEYASAEILERSGDTVRFRLAMHPDQNGKIWSWVSERTPDRSTRTVVARRVEPGPFEFMDIKWFYEPEGSGTRMRWVQDFRMRPDAPIDTEAMTDRINANTAMQMTVIAEKVQAAARQQDADVAVEEFST
jgi:ribosome-associated toxin RatA of RatAB toxin-antitoxin module